MMQKKLKNATTSRILSSANSAKFHNDVIIRILATHKTKNQVQFWFLEEPKKKYHPQVE